MPRKGRVWLMALLVPAVGAAGGAAGPLFRGARDATYGGGPLLVVTAVVAFLLCFALVSLSAIWLLEKASLVVAHVRANRDHRRTSRRTP